MKKVLIQDLTLISRPVRALALIGIELENCIALPSPSEMIHRPENLET